MAGRTLIIAVAFILMTHFVNSENVDHDRVLLDRFNSMEMEIERLAQRVNDLETNDEIKSKQIRQLDHQVQTLTMQNLDLQLQQEESVKTILGLEADIEQLKGKIVVNDVKPDGLNGDSWPLYNDTMDSSGGEEDDYRLNTGKPSIVRQRSGRSIADGAPKVAFYAQVDPHDYGPLGKDQTIVFANAITNVGNAYHAHDGIFIAPVDGVYVITVTIAGWRHTIGQTYVHVRVNTNDICSIWAADADQSSQTLILNLNQNDDVYTVNNVASDFILGATYSTFSGFLLYPTEGDVAIVGK